MVEASIVWHVQGHKAEKVIVYLLTCACVDFFEAALLQVPELKGVRLHALHGRMKQANRESTLQAYTTQAAGTSVPILCFLLVSFLNHTSSGDFCARSMLAAGQRFTSGTFEHPIGTSGCYVWLAAEAWRNHCDRCLCPWLQSRACMCQ